MLLMLFYLLLLIIQLLGESIQYRTGYACEGSSLTIQCDEPNYINLIRANFGRFSITICNQKGNLEWSVNCGSSEASTTIKRNCNGKSYCLLPASSAYFGDPCPNTHKYLEVHYECVPKVPKSASDAGLISSNHSLYDRIPKNQITPPPIIIPTVNPHLRPSSTPINNNVDIASSPPYSSSNGSPVSMVTPLAPSMPSSSSSSSGDTSIDSPSQAGIIMMSGLDVDVDGSSPEGGRTSDSSSQFGSSSNNQHHNPTSNRQSNGITSDKSRTDDGGAVYVRHPYPRPLTTSSTSKYNDGKSIDYLNGNSDLTGSGNGQLTSSNSENERRFRLDPNESILTMNGDQVDKSLLSEFCLPDKQRDLWWNYTKIGQTATQPCPGGSKGEAKWICVRQQNGPAMWVPPKPDFSDCNSLWMINLENRLRNGEGVINIASELEQKIRTNTLYGGDIHHATDVLHALVGKMETIIEEFPDLTKRNQILKELLIVNIIIHLFSNLIPFFSLPLSFLFMFFFFIFSFHFILSCHVVCVHSIFFFPSFSSSLAIYYAGLQSINHFVNNIRVLSCMKPLAMFLDCVDDDDGGRHKRMMIFHLPFFLLLVNNLN